jgi:hypothetical protein
LELKLVNLKKFPLVLICREEIHLDFSSSEEVSSDNKLKLSLRDDEEERV